MNLVFRKWVQIGVIVHGRGYDVDTAVRDAIQRGLTCFTEVGYTTLWRIE